MEILAQRNFGADKLAPRPPEGVWSTEDLFPFDEQAVFTCSGDPQNRKGFYPRKPRVFSVNRDGILTSRDVDALARTRYGLASNQWFLGKIGANVFYWESGKPTIVYYRTVEEKQAAHCFKLPKADDMILGVKKALRANKDVGFFAVGTRSLLGSLWNFGAGPGLPVFVEFSFKDAKPVRN